jgi:cytidylate kinase
MPIITISRGTMSGGKALAECVAAALGSPCIAREVLVEGAQKLGVSEEFLREKMERSPGLWERLTTERRIYLLATQAALVEYAAKGDVVYHGLAGHLLLRDLPEVLRVRLIAPIEARILTLMEQRRLSRDEATRFIADVDQHRARWTRLMYDADIEDPRLYDLVLNLEKTSIDSACAVVLWTARQREFSLTDASRARLADFAIACRVRLALATDTASRGLDLAVSSSDGVVTLTGEVPKPEMLTRTSEQWVAEIRRVVEKVAGVQSVAVDIEVVSPYH